eukprot:8967748-Prorocentrum_lima.AAC.1
MERLTWSPTSTSSDTLQRSCRWIEGGSEMSPGRQQIGSEAQWAGGLPCPILPGQGTCSPWQATWRLGT